MRGHSTSIRFGTSYCPFAKSADVDMSQWDRDFRTMKELSFNAVRCFVAWDRIETTEGHYDFIKVDHIFELAERHEIDVMLNVGGVFACYGGIYPPRWLIHDHHCQEVVEDPRQVRKPFGPYRMICLDDETYRAKAEAFTVRMIKRYAPQKRLFGWNVWNEAFLKPQCFCPATLARFRDWLKTRYANDLDALNRIWGTEFPVLYRTWDEIEPPLGAGFLAGGTVARLDWQRFNQDRVAGWVAGVDRLVREHDHQHRPTSSNIVASTVIGETTWHGQPDLWSQTRSLDIAGFSFYTHGTPSHISAALAAVRGSSNDPAHAFWVLETEAGLVGDAKLYPDEIADGPRRVATHWLSVLHGARTILLWKFGGRVTDTQTDVFNLTAWDGSITDRARLNAGVASILRQHERLFLERSYRAEVGILFHSDNALFSQVTDRLGDWTESWRGAWKTLRDLRVPADFISDVQASADGALDRFRVLVLPHVMSIDAKLAQRIAAFVRQGGTVIADQRLAVFDDSGRNQLRTPGFGLEAVFGAYRNDMVFGASEMPVALNGGGTLTVNGNYRSTLLPSDPACAIVGRWPDGSAAITALGTALWFGFQPFRDHGRKPSPGILTLIRDVLARAGVVSDYTVDGLATDHEVEFGAITGDDGTRVHVITNLGASDQRISLDIASAKHGRLQDLLTGSVIDLGKGPAQIHLPAWGAMVLVEPTLLMAATP